MHALAILLAGFVVIGVFVLFVSLFAAFDK
jgi:hypothetical protein